MLYRCLIILLFALFCSRVQAAERYGVMCYHDVVEESHLTLPKSTDMQSELQRQYFPQTITVNRLVSYFNWLRDNGYTPVSWQQIEDARLSRGHYRPNRYCSRLTMAISASTTASTPCSKLTTTPLSSLW